MWLVWAEVSGASVQALESLLNNYKARHVECLHGTTLPRKYILVEMWDEYAGLGNQFPSLITGPPQCSPSPCYSASETLDMPKEPLEALAC